MHQNFTWYLPSVYGDITLARVTADRTRLTLVGLSPTEKEAVKALLQRAVKPAVMSTVWATASEVAEVDLGSLREQTLTLNAPLSKVQDFLQKKLKPHRKQVSAVRFTSGRLEELSEATLKVIDSTTPSEASVDESAPLAATGTDSSAPVKPKDKPERAVTVARPVRGCPAPDFDDVMLRANRVLSAFLDPEQVDDFNTRQQFVAIGADTGHRYLLTSRTSRYALGSTGHRSLFDIDENQAFCVHDWEVPPGEELLGLFVHISLPGHETYVRGIPDLDGLLERVPDTNIIGVMPGRG